MEVLIETMKQWRSNGKLMELVCHILENISEDPGGDLVRKLAFKMPDIERVVVQLFNVMNTHRERFV